MRGRRRDERIGNAEGDARNVSRIEMIRVSPSSWLDYYFDSISNVGLIYRELNGDIRPTFFLSIDSRPTIRKISSARRSSASDLDSASRCRKSRWNLSRGTRAINNRANTGSDRGGKEERSHKRSDCIPSRHGSFGMIMIGEKEKDRIRVVRGSKRDLKGKK